MPARIDLLTLSAAEIGTFLGEFGWPRYRAQQVLRWLYQRRVTDPQSMTDLSKPDRGRLGERAFIGSLVPSQIRKAEDGTQKFVFALTDGKIIESVLIPDNRRLTLCLSTQVGCSLDCLFCLTGRMGLLRNLQPHEIIGQLLAVERHISQHSEEGANSYLDPLAQGTPRGSGPFYSHPPTPGAPGRAPSRVTNLVFMGMGEPLANIAAVEEAVRRLTNSHWGCGFSPRRLTLSTAGLASRIRRMADMGINLAVSLNATTDSQRRRLMPAASSISSLATLLNACREFPQTPHRDLTFEYVLLKGENDSDQDARRLVSLVSGISRKINLIPFNEFPGSSFRRPSDQDVERFQSILRRSDLQVFIRKSKGRDILGACGQLGEIMPQPLLQPVGTAS
jgi:23S rRNA (adenine2503-C2)-methyltransferase